jgi:hypothetical protein
MGGSEAHNKLLDGETFEVLHCRLTQQACLSVRCLVLERVNSP